MKIFRLHRETDISGTSGTGNAVAYGVVLNTGRCILTWRTEYSSIAIYDNIEALTAIHSHNGATRVEYFESSKSNLRALEAFLSGDPLADTHSKGKKRKKGQKDA